MMEQDAPNLPETQAGAAENKPGFSLALRQGDACPECGRGKMEYNGLLELECPFCGYRNTGGAIGT